MKIVVFINHFSTGGCHYCMRLLTALKKIEDVNIDIYITSYHNKIELLRSVGINIYYIKIIDYLQLKNIKNPIILLKNFAKFLLNTIITFQGLRLKMYIEHTYDFIFYPWPYDIKPINISLPLFFVPHDFIQSHFFGLAGRPFWCKEEYQDIYSKISLFVKYGHAIVSSYFIKSEYLLQFPMVNNIDVVYLSKLNDYKFVSSDNINIILSKYGIKNEYILWASNTQLHKNINQMIGAYYYIKQRYQNIKLVLTGDGTNKIRLKSTTHYYADQLIGNDDEWDILGLGELSEYEFSCILQGAKIVVNTSLCEAGNGSGLDAWSMGIPVAQSDIPAFNEHLKFLGVKAEVFDPRNDKSIAEAVFRVLDNPKLAKENSDISKLAIENYSWDNIAIQYYNIFLKYNNINNQSSKTDLTSSIISINISNSVLNKSS